MKYIVMLLCLFNAYAQYLHAAPSLIFNGYIDYPGRHDYRIEVFTYPSGLISRVVTYSGDPQVKYEEMVISEEKKGIQGFDQFQRNKRTFSMLWDKGILRLTVENENIDSHESSTETNVILINHKADELFADNKRSFSIQKNGDMHIKPIGTDGESTIVSNNQILTDGWYRSDWKRDAGRMEIREFTTMEKQGDWISDGGGFFTGTGLHTNNLGTNIMNYYILDIYIQRWIFLPFIFGLQTGSY